MRRIQFGVIAALAAIPMAAFAAQPQADAPQEKRPGTTEGKAEGKKAAAVGLASADPYGAYLVDARGRALYMFEADRGKRGSICYDACAEAWPPLLTSGDPRLAAPALDEEQLGTIERKDGTQQVTYGGWPLYYYIRDRKAGQTLGQDVHGFGGGWYLVGPEGKPIHATKN